jgi:hypothetical protein
LREAWHRVSAEEIALFCSLCQRGAALDSVHAHAHSAAAILAARQSPVESELSATERAASESAPGKS